MKKFTKARTAKRIAKLTNTNKDWGFVPVPNKGGKTTNATIVAFKREAENLEGGAVDA